MLFSDIGVSTRSGSDQVPDGIVVAKRASRNDFPETNLVAILRYLEVRAIIDPECRAYIERYGDLPLGSNLDYLHKGNLTASKLSLSTVLLMRE